MSLKTDKAIRLMKILDIPCLPIYQYHPNVTQYDDGEYHHTSSIRVDDLYDIFTDDEKLKILIGKLKNKAFW